MYDDNGCTQKLRLACGELCDTTRPISAAAFLGSVRAELDCPALFRTLQQFQQPGGGPGEGRLPPRVSQLPPGLAALYSQEGRVGLENLYFDNTAAGAGRQETRVWSKAEIQGFSESPASLHST